MNSECAMCSEEKFEDSQSDFLHLEYVSLNIIIIISQVRSLADG